MTDYSFYASDYARTATQMPENLEVFGTIAGVIAGMGMMFMVISLIFLILTVVANWKIFTKAGEKGWKALIPIYNTYTLIRISGLSGWWLLGMLAAVIPGVGMFVVLGIDIYIMYNLSKAFGKGGGFTIGLILLGPIFQMILGFGSAEYQLGKAEEVKTENN